MNPGATVGLPAGSLGGWGGTRFTAQDFHGIFLVLAASFTGSSFTEPAPLLAESDCWAGPAFKDR